MRPRPLSELISVDVNNIDTAYAFMGCVETAADLWAQKNPPKTGEIRYVVETGANYVWIGNNWEMLYDHPALRPVPMEIPKHEYIRPTYPDPTLDLKGIWHLVKCFFNYNFVRLGWSVQLA